MSNGELMGNLVVEVLRKWKDVPDWLAGLCFDTTSSDTGVHAGAITIIQKAYDKHLLFYLAGIIPLKLFWLQYLTSFSSLQVHRLEYLVGSKNIGNLLTLPNTVQLKLLTMMSNLNLQLLNVYG